MRLRASFLGRDLAALPPSVLLVGQEGAEAQRAGSYSPASVRGHPGKMLPALARALVELYTRPGDLVLDPMSGIGTTGVEAVRLGRRYVGVELEPRFAAWQRENLERASGAGQDGGFEVAEGDARRLVPAPGTGDQGEVPVPQPDAIVTSPPYGDRLREQRNPSRRLRELIRAGRFGRGVLPGTYGTSPGNLGNLPASAHLREMERVWRACHSVLRPGGILAVVVQPERSRRELVPLHHEAARACLAAGFSLLDELVAVLGRVTLDRDGRAGLVSHASFWKRLATARLRDGGLPVTLGQAEHVLVFRRPGGEAPRAAAAPPPPAAPRRAKAAVGPPLPARSARLGSGCPAGPCCEVRCRPHLIPSLRAPASALAPVKGGP